MGVHGRPLRTTLLGLSTTLLGESPFQSAQCLRALSQHTGGAINTYRVGESVHRCSVRAGLHRVKTGDTARHGTPRIATDHTGVRT